MKFERYCRKYRKENNILIKLNLKKVLLKYIVAKIYLYEKWKTLYNSKAYKRTFNDRNRIYLDECDFENNVWNLWKNSINW